MKKKIGKLEELIRAEASKENVIVNDFTMIMHNNVCKELVKLCDKHNYPMTQLVYVAIGKNAHKPIIFEKGYSKIDVEKAELMIKLSEVFAKKFGTKWRNSGFLCHMIDRYLEITKHRKELKFRQIVNDCNVDFNTIKIDTAKKLAMNFFGNEAEYTNGGYIVSVKDCM